MKAIGHSLQSSQGVAEQVRKGAADAAQVLARHDEVIAVCIEVANHDACRVEAINGVVVYV